jgi:hypothetical protein
MTVKNSESKKLVIMRDQYFNHAHNKLDLDFDKSFITQSQTTLEIWFENKLKKECVFVYFITQLQTTLEKQFPKKLRNESVFVMFY